MAKNMRVHELAKELGMTNAEAMDLAGALGVPVKSHSSSLNEAYADMMRRRAVRDGLTRDEQPEEPKPAKKAPPRRRRRSRLPSPSDAADSDARRTRRHRTRRPSLNRSFPRPLESRPRWLQLRQRRQPSR